MALFIANNGQLQTIKRIYKGLGRNLLLPSGINYNRTTVQDETFMGNRVVRMTPNGWQRVVLTVSNITPDTDYTFSIYYRTTIPTGYVPWFWFIINEYDSDNAVKVIYQLPTNEQTNVIKNSPDWCRFFHTFKTSSTGVKIQIDFGNHGWNSQERIVYASTPKVEEGTVATEWVPAQGTNTPY